MDEDKIRELIEEIDPKGEISDDRIASFVDAVKELEKNPPKDGEVRDGMHFSVLESELKQKLLEEKDWRVRASIAAKIISLNLE